MSTPHHKHSKPHIRRVRLTLAGAWVWGVFASHTARMPLAASQKLHVLKKAKVFRKRG